MSQIPIRRAAGVILFCLLPAFAAAQSLPPAAGGSAPPETIAPAPALAATTPAVPALAAKSLAEPLEPPQVDARTLRGRQLTEAGIRYENAEGVSQDFARAITLYCAAARADFPDALLRLGWNYANGRGVARNEAIAHTLFRRAARLGSDMGERLADLFPGFGEQLPACMGGDEAQLTEADLQGPPNPGLLPTPTVDAPAQFRASAPPIERRKLVEMVVRLARQFKLDPRLVLALINTESGFDPFARSNKNALGLMQLIPETADRFLVKDAFDPEDNLRGGMSYLKWLLAYFKGDVVLAVAGYNAGEGAVDRFRGVPPYAETMAYVQRIRTVYPLDRHPFDPAATLPSLMFNLKRTTPTSQTARANPG